ncbi:PEP-CTERM sorting domain-containing protein [Crocosphaera watsonii]|nr:PEP-CTERM sorting domain-containing protein [Crocosphaera watsonii]
MEKLFQQTLFMRNYLLGSLLTIGLSFSIFSEVKAATISLDFDRLPNQQGWIRESNRSGTAFSVDGTKLIQNSIGRGSFVKTFRMNNVIDPDKHFTLSFTARYLNQEVVSSTVSTFSFVVYLYDANRRFHLAFGRSAFQNRVDTSVFNDYRLEGSFSTGVASLYINDTFIRDFNTETVRDSRNFIGFGDSTYTANAHAELTNFTFTQKEISAVPEPLTILGTGTAIAFGAGFKRKLAKTKKK